MYWLGKYLDPVTLTYILRSSAFYTFYIDVQYLLNYKAYNHQTLHSASPQCTDSAGTLTQWPWHIFCTPLTFTPFTSTFHMSSTIRPSTSKPCIVLLLDVLTRQVTWPGDLDLYFALQWLTHFTMMFDISSNISPTTTKPCIVLHLIVLDWQVPWPGDLDLYLTHFTLMFGNSSTIRPTTTISCVLLLHDVLTAGTLTRWPIFPAPVTFTHFTSTFHYHWAV